MFFKNVFMTLRRFSTLNASRQILQTGKNLINPGPNDPVAFGYYFPKEWNQEKIHALLDPLGKQITSVKIVANKLGQSSGKILFTFKSVELMKKYIDRYNEDFIQTEDSVHRVVLRRFQLKSQLKKKQRADYSKKYGVHLVNLDFDIDEAQLQRLAQDFGQIQYIDLHIKQNGMNRGGAKIYFKTRKQSLQFRQFSDGLKYKQRKLKCSVIKQQHQLQKSKQIRQIQAPKLVMKWNEQLYKRMVKKQAQQINKENTESKVY